MRYYTMSKRKLKMWEGAENIACKGFKGIHLSPSTLYQNEKMVLDKSVHFDY